MGGKSFISGEITEKIKYQWPENKILVLTLQSCKSKGTYFIVMYDILELQQRCYQIVNILKYYNMNFRNWYYSISQTTKKKTSCKR